MSRVAPIFRVAAGHGAINTGVRLPRPGNDLGRDEEAERDAELIAKDADRGGGGDFARREPDGGDFWWQLQNEALATGREELTREDNPP